jgi:protein gp37
MGKKTNVPWTDSTCGLWKGCTPIATGCQNCWARGLISRMKAGDPDIVTRCSYNKWRLPWQWNTDAMVARKKRLVFLCPASDFWHPGADQWRDEAYRLIDRCQWLTFQILTKRPERILANWADVEESPYISEAGVMNDFQRGYRKNVWLLASASDQESAEHVWGPLVEASIYVPVFGLSLEPIVGPIDLEKVWRNGPLPGWIIVGAETGPIGHRRPCELEWFEQIAEQCSEAGVPLFVKQWCGLRPGERGPLTDELWARKEMPPR